MALSDFAGGKTQVDRTVTVLNNTVSPTAEFVHNRDTEYDIADIHRLLKHAAKEIESRAFAGNSGCVLYICAVDFGNVLIANVRSVYREARSNGYKSFFQIFAP